MKCTDKYIANLKAESKQLYKREGDGFGIRVYPARPGTDGKSIHNGNHRDWFCRWLSPGATATKKCFSSGRLIFAVAVIDRTGGPADMDVHDSIT